MDNYETKAIQVFKQLPLRKQKTLLTVAQILMLSQDNSLDVLNETLGIQDDEQSEETLFLNRLFATSKNANAQLH